MLYSRPVLRQAAVPSGEPCKSTPCFQIRRFRDFRLDLGNGMTIAESLRDIVRYREFIRNLVLRDLKVRYRNSFLGFIWSLLNPLLMMSVYTVVFSVLLRNDIPNFPLFVLVGLLPWNFAVASVMGSVTSVVGNSHLIKKVYFPREVLPLALVLSNLVNFALALPVLFLLMAITRTQVTSGILLLPVIMFIQTLFLLGLGFFLASINVFFRDTEVIVEVLVLAWFFLCPVFYRMETLSEQYSRILYWVNPMASLISSYRLILYDHSPPDLFFLVRTLITASIFLVAGYAVFRRLSPRFGEEV